MKFRVRRFDREIPDSAESPEAFTSPFHKTVPGI